MGSSSVAVTDLSDVTAHLSKKSFENQGITECRFTLNTYVTWKKTHRQQSKIIWIMYIVSIVFFRPLKLKNFQSWIFLGFCTNRLAEYLAFFLGLLVAGHNFIVAYLENFYRNSCNRWYPHWISIFTKQMKKKKNLISQIKELTSNKNKSFRNSRLKIWKKILKPYSWENCFPWDSKIKYTCIFTNFIIGNIFKILG